MDKAEIKTEKELPRNESKSSGSVATEHTKRDQAVEELGRRIIGELELRDITEKWMASYLSEIMMSAEENPDLKMECRDLIISLWRERHRYPGGNPLKRYAGALKAMELLLSIDDSVFQVCIPYKAPDEHEEEKVIIARKLKHYADSLVAILIKTGVEDLDIDQSKLVKIADTADPDAETRLLNILSVEVCEGRNQDDRIDANRKICENISDIRATLTELETTLQRDVDDPRTNIES